MDRINRLVVDSTGATTGLCTLGAEFVTDKSPYNPGQHRHPYTAVYDLLFAAKRFEPLLFGEIGIAYNASMKMWRSYFPNATLYGYEFDPELLAQGIQDGLRDTHYLPINIADPMSIAEALAQPGKPFDVLIDDSTHLFDHQINFVKAGLRFVRSGGIMVIEDIFRPWDENRFTEALRSYFEYFSSGTFIETNHEKRRSLGDQEPWFDNDKLLVLFRNETAYAAS
jgi:hypothetical protein